MHVLVVGKGGRAHALAWKLAQSPRVKRISVAPGNGGTEQVPNARNVDIDTTDIVSLLDFAESEGVDLTIVGPEEPLAGGLVDQFEAVGLRTFGPRRNAAMIETSKSYAKELMIRCGVPTAPYEVFTELDPALDHLMRHPVHDIVIKADGLARGKGVFLPRGESDAEGILRALLERDALGGAGRSVILEKRLVGPEVSVLAFTDGDAIAMMPPVHDYKRLRDGASGPNTGGMGSLAPAPALTPALITHVRDHILAPILAGMRAEGIPFKGVLYVGLVLTDDGPQALELNVRLGDPSAQVVLPLLESDLLDVLEACVGGSLGALDIRWRDAAAVTVVLATAGYPERNDPDLPIVLPDDVPDGVVLFHAGTRYTADGLPVTTGGRVLNVTCVEPDLAAAVTRAYEVARRVHFEGRQFRTDIGAEEWRS